MAEDHWIEIRGLRFPDRGGYLTDAMRRDFDEAGRNEGYSRKVLSMAKPDDRVIVIGAGAGMVPVLLAGQAGVRHVHVVEPERPRQDYLQETFEANGLVRVTLSQTLAAPFTPTLLVADLTETGGRFPDGTLLAGLRGAVVRLSED